MDMEQKKQTKETDFPVSKTGFLWIIAGALLMLIGFILMSGGKSNDPNVFSEALYSFRRITLAPIVVIASFVMIGIGIMRRPKSKE